MVRIFFDTEFTGLTTDAKLISIGLVDESGQHDFYAELSDTYTVADCSESCRQEVLPLLEGGSARPTAEELRQQLRSWLTGVATTRSLCAIPRATPFNCGASCWSDCRQT